MPAPVIINELSRTEIDEIKRGLDELAQEIMSSGLTPDEFLRSRGFMTDEEDEDHLALKARSWPLGQRPSFESVSD